MVARQVHRIYIKSYLNVRIVRSNAWHNRPRVVPGRRTALDDMGVRDVGDVASAVLGGLAQFCVL